MISIPSSLWEGGKKTDFLPRKPIGTAIFLDCWTMFIIKILSDQSIPKMNKNDIPELVPSSLPLEFVVPLFFNVTGNFFSGNKQTQTVVGDMLPLCSE